MSEREMNDQEWELLLKHSVIQHYTNSAAEVTYNSESWNSMQQMLEHRCRVQVRKYKAQSFSLGIASLLLFMYVFAGPAQMNARHPFTRVILDVKQEVTAYLEKLEKNDVPIHIPMWIKVKR